MGYARASVYTRRILIERNVMNKEIHIRIDGGSRNAAELGKLLTNKILPKKTEAQNI